MKKKSIKSLRLNKKLISNLETYNIEGGINPAMTSAYCIPTTHLPDPTPVPAPNNDTRRVCDESIKLCV